jgi:2-keto-3-deoxy-L-rhamnonate aldolase RhmA
MDGYAILNTDDLTNYLQKLEVLEDSPRSLNASLEISRLLDMGVTVLIPLVTVRAWQHLGGM